ncbi:MAG: hypothetical protein WBH08_05190 [Methanothrix sp.]|uniref:hypothetical protein n=1 Tax=Methanothrix sp. TaxID=90426 RepID=UPI003BB50CBA
MAVLIVLGAAALSLLAADGIESEGLTITGSATPISGPMNMDAQSMEDKIADLQSGPVSNANQSNNKHSTFFSIGIDTVQSNGSTVDLSKLINLSSNDSTNSSAANASIINTRTLNWTALNTTAFNATAVNASDRKDSMSSPVSGIGRTAACSEGASSSSQSSSKGTQNYSSSQGGLGKSKIKSSTSLEGDFEVQISSSY